MPPVDNKNPVALFVEELLCKNKVVIFSKTTCPWCVKVKELFKELNEKFVAVELDLKDDGDEIKNYLVQKTKLTTVPNVFVNGNHVGGYDSTSNSLKEGTLVKLLNRMHFYARSFS
jgi:glutaredoxin